jgi:hypothetical protein
MSRIRSMLPLPLGLLLGLAAGWVAFPYLLYEREEQPLSFSHATHAGEAVGLSCADCHGFEADGRFVGVPPIEQCAGCHEEKLGDSADEAILVRDYVQPRREVPWRVYAREPDNAYFPHVVHVRQAGIPCERCHGPHGLTASLRPLERDRVSGYSRDIWGERISGIATASWDGKKMSDCLRCHATENVAASCQDCHR